MGWRSKDNIQVFCRIILQSLGFIAHTWYGYVAFLLVHWHGEVTIYVGSHTLWCSFYLYNGKGDTHSVLVLNGSFEGVLSLFGILHLKDVDDFSINIVHEMRMWQKALHCTQLVDVIKWDGEKQRVILHIVGIINLVVALCCKEIQDISHALVLKWDWERLARHLWERRSSPYEDQEKGHQDYYGR